MPNKQINLYPYQQNILNELKYLKAIGLFTKTGSGKTLMALHKFLESGCPHLLVLTPSKALKQWQLNVEDYTDCDIVRFYNNNSGESDKLLKNISLKKSRAIIISLESIAKFDNINRLINEDWFIILDESHKIKEVGTVRKPILTSKKCLELGLKTPHKAILTATPIQKKLGGWVDYYNQLKFLGYLTMDYRSFKTKFCIIKKIQIVGTPFPIDTIAGYKNTHIIENILKLTCRSHNPKYGDYEPVFKKIEIKICESYKSTVKNKWYKDIEMINLPARRIAYKTLTSGVIQGKTINEEKIIYKDNTYKIDWLKEFIIENEDTKILVLYKYNVERDQIEELCKSLNISYIIIDGANKNKYDDIMHKEYTVVIGQFNACGESLDGLQYKSSTCVYFCMPESSIEYKQSLGRLDRTGQTEVPVYYFLVMKGTIDELIYDMTLKKVEYSEDTLNKLLII